MINLPLLSFFIINLSISPTFAADEVNTLPLERSSLLGSYMLPSLPQMNIDYDTLTPDTSENLQPVLNFEEDGSIYCPHTEILAKILNELRSSLSPQGGDKIKDVLSNYYTILQNALNSKQSLESLNEFNSKNHLNYIDSLAQKFVNMDEKNVKIKISFEYSLPTMHKSICEKLCNDLINFASAGNSAANNDLNYANEPGKIKNNVMTFLHNYRPDNVNFNSPANTKLKNQFPVINKPDYFYPPNLDILPSIPMTFNAPISNPLQNLSQRPSNQTENPIPDPSQTYAPLLQSPTETDFHSSRNLSPPLATAKGNANFISSPNFATILKKNTGIAHPNPSKYLLNPPPNPTKSSNSYASQNLALLLSNLIGKTDTSVYSTQRSFPPIPESKGTSNSYPLQSLAPLVPSSRLTANSNPFQILSPHHQMLKGTPNFYPLPFIAPPQPYQKGTGSVNPLQIAAPILHNPTGPQDSYPIPNLPSQLQKLTENAKDIKEFAKKLDEKYDKKINSNHQKIQKLIQYNKNNAAQYLSENKATLVTPTKYGNPRSWNQPNYISTDNKYSNNEKLLQERVIQLYNQYKPAVTNLVLEATTPAPVNLYEQFNRNSLPSIKQYENRNLAMDLSSSQANTLDHYNQYLQSMKRLIYPQTNPGTGQQIPYPPLNYIPFSYEKNNALYNPYVKNFNQLATQSNILNQLGLYPNSNYYYYNPNLGITNIAKDTQENYGVQFQDLNRLLAVSNLDKLNSVSNKNGIIELTYKLKQSKPFDEPFYYVKYRLPSDVFLDNLKRLLIEKPNLRIAPYLLYKDLLTGSNITSTSSDLKSLDKEELFRLVTTNGTLVTAKVLAANDTTAHEQIKIVQKLNANMPLEDIVKSDANITKIPNLTSNIPLMGYMRNSPNYLNDLQTKIAMKRYYLNPYNSQANLNYNQYVQYQNYLANRLPMQGYNYLQKKITYPYFPYRVNSFPKYYGYKG